MALRIARKPGEVILVIQEGRVVMRIKVEEVLHGKVGRVNLVFEAPESISIVREELVSEHPDRLK